MDAARIDCLRDLLAGLGSVAIGYSGGVDSTFLLAVATRVPGVRAVGFIGCSPAFPVREKEEAIRIAAQIGATVRLIETRELDDPDFTANSPTRCFRCKTSLFSTIAEAAAAEGLAHVLEGANADDRNDFRPGMEATRALGVRSPLLELGFTKDEIRQLSQQMNLPTWDKPSFACLASRIPWGSVITAEKLARIEQAEDALRDMGFVQCRVRDYDTQCRIEVLPGELGRLLDDSLREALVARMKAAGYVHVALDLEGYRTGAMNEVLVKVMP